MEKENFQNTAEFKLRDTSEMKPQSENSDALSDDYSEKSMKKQNIVAIIICVIIAFVIWLIISNINYKATTPAPLPLQDTSDTPIVLNISE
jgi:hypothetical protein